MKRPSLPLTTLVIFWCVYCVAAAYALYQALPRLNRELLLILAGAGIFPVVILFFTSSALVPVATMPGWLQAFAKANPITVITDALRALCLGGPTTRPAAEAAAWLIGLLAVTVPATIARYRHATST